MKKVETLIILMLIATFGVSQKPTIELKAYADTYFAVFDDEKAVNSLQSFSTVSPRDRQVSLNVAQLGLHYESKDIRSNMTLHYGDIAKATWSSRFPVVQEANVGVHLFPNWWLDVGLFTTHIGTESFLPKNNYLSSTAVLTYNEPFYQGGAKLAYEGSDKFDLELWMVNGYNQFADVNRDQSYGILFTYNINKNHSITYTNLIGNEQADLVEEKQLRTYQNIYINSNFKDKVILQVGADYGTQSNYAAGSSDVSMYGLITTARFRLTEKFSTTVRYEVFNDPSGFISGVYFTDNLEVLGLQLQGTTLGLEYKPSKNSYWRAEGRFLGTTDDRLQIFNNGSRTNRLEFMTTIGCFFDNKW